MFVTQFSGQGGDNRGPLPAPSVPAVEHDFVTLTATPQKIAVIDRKTNIVRIAALVNSVFEIIEDAATNITLTATNGEFLAAGADCYRTTPQEAGNLALWARTA